MEEKTKKTATIIKKDIRKIRNDEKSSALSARPAFIFSYLSSLPFFFSLLSLLLLYSFLSNLFFSLLTLLSFFLFPSHLFFLFLPLSFFLPLLSRSMVVRSPFAFSLIACFCLRIRPLRPIFSRFVRLVGRMPAQNKFQKIIKFAKIILQSIVIFSGK